MWYHSILKTGGVLHAMVMDREVSSSDQPRRHPSTLLTPFFLLDSLPPPPQPRGWLTHVVLYHSASASTRSLLVFVEGETLLFSFAIAG